MDEYTDESVPAMRARMKDFIQSLKCCGNCKLFCDRTCPKRERIDDDQTEYPPPDSVCDLWIHDGKTFLERVNS
jgi:hypothetical protein